MKDGFVVGSEEEDILDDSEFGEGGEDDKKDAEPKSKLVGLTAEDREMAEEGRRA